MCSILIFGGTTEGRILAEYCHENKISAWVSVATEYGKMVLPESRYLHIQKSPMNAGEMEQFIRQENIQLVFDATHPYATEVSKNILTACEGTKTKRIRVVRKNSADMGGPCETEAEEMRRTHEPENVIRVGSVKEAVLYLNSRQGNVLVTTGSKELSLFTALDSFEERIYARVLPFESVISACEQMGIRGKHLIGMQGPFSVEMNQAMINEYHIQYLVTKEAGNVGGYPEKIRAAQNCGIKVIVVGLPGKEEGIAVEEAKNVLKNLEQSLLSLKPGPQSHILSEKKGIALIGIGMGGPDQMTVRALKELQACDVVFGAKRMLCGISHLVPNAVQQPFYLSKEILPWLEEHKEYNRIGIVYSGDTGFYSGAKNMANDLNQEPYSWKYRVEIFPGLSSLSYLCSRLKTGWEDIRLVSLHGRDWDIVEELKDNSRIFVLLDGANTVKNLCSLLKDRGFSKVRLSVGERLSYAGERIRVGTPEELELQEFDNLSVVLIER